MDAIDLQMHLRECSGVSIFTHIRPDGDAVGSTLAWKRIIETNTELPVQIYCPDTIPPKYSFLPGVDDFRQVLESSLHKDLVFVLDCSDLGRLDYLKENLQQHDLIINIDHHITNDRFGRYNLVDPAAAATAEILYLFSLENGLQIDQEAGLALYAALVSDTGFFKYDNTTPETMRISADLLAKGIVPSLVSLKLFDERPYTTLLLLAETLQSLTLDQDKKIAWMSIDDEKIAACGANPAELDGFVNYLRDLEGVEVGILFYHANQGNTKVGLRSKSLDVARVASTFGGGGHPRAAGCTLQGAPAETTRRVLQAVSSSLQEK